MVVNRSQRNVSMTRSEIEESIKTVTQKTYDQKTPAGEDLPPPLIDERTGGWNPHITHLQHERGVARGLITLHVVWEVTRR